MANTPVTQETFVRAVQLAQGSYDDATRMFQASVSSETPVRRWIWAEDFAGAVDEVLSHEKGAVDMTRMNSGCPILYNHESDDQVGVVHSATLNAGERKLRIVGRMAKGETDDQRQINANIADGILTGVSIGYQIIEYQLEPRDGDVPIMRATKWLPFEVSLAPVPADASVGVGRKFSSANTAAEDVPTGAKPAAVEPVESQPQSPTVENHRMNEPNTPQTPAITPQITAETRYKSGSEAPQAFPDHAAWQRALKETATMLPGSERFLAQAVAENKSPQEFARDFVKSNPQPINPAQEIRTMSDKDKPRFSLGRAIQLLAAKKPLDGIEAEATQEMERQVGEQRRAQMRHGSFLIPADLYRAATAGVSTAGGFTVGAQMQAVIPELTNQTVLDRMGIASLNGLTGDVLFPVLQSGTTAYWVAETGAVTDSQPVWAQKVMTPKRVGSTVPFSTQLLAQSSLSIETVMRNVLMRHLDLAEDLAGLEGTGGVQPLGVKTTSGINSTVTFGGSATWADIVEFETGINADNADIGSMGFVLSAATVGKWKTILRDSVAGAAYLIGDGGLINGYRYARTNQVTGNIAFFGVWSALTRGRWTGDEIIVDPYALKKSGQVEVTINRLVDFLVTQPLAFNVSTDTAAA